MKKVSLAMSLFVLVFFLFSLASCDSASTKESGKESEETLVETVAETVFVPETAKELWEKINANMDALKSYDGTGEIDAAYYYQGQEVTVKGTSDMVLMDTSEHYFNYQRSEMNLIIPSLEIEEVMVNSEAYCDGKMYVSVQNPSYDQNLMSEISKERFLATWEDEDSISDLDFSACAESEFSQKDDGTWEILFSGSTKKVVDSFLEVMGFDDDELGADVEDMKISILATEDFYAKSMTIELVFDSEATVKPLFVVTMHYGNFDTVVFDASVIDEEKYTLVPDLDKMLSVSDSFEEYLAKEKGGFTLEADMVVEAMGSKESQTDTYKIDYGTENGAFYYNAEITDGQGSYKVEYKNGSETVTYGTESDTYSFTPEEAKEYVISVMDVALFDSDSVSGIEKVEDGIYRFTIENAKDLSLDSILDPSTGVTAVSMKEEMIVTFDEEGWTRIVTTLDIVGTYSYGGSKETVTFSYVYTVSLNEALSNADA